MKRPRPDTLPELSWPRLIATAVVWLVLGYLSLVGFMAITGGK